MKFQNFILKLASNWINKKKKAFSRNLEENLKII